MTTIAARRNALGLTQRRGRRVTLAALGIAAALSWFGQAHADEISNDWAINFVKAPSAWLLGYTGAGVTVAVMDTGVAKVSEFNGRLLPMWNGYTNSFVADADDNGHGTFVAGLIGAARNNTGTVGVAYDATILPIKIMNKRGVLQLSDAALAKAYDTARLQGAKVSNNSWNTSTTASQMVAYYGYTGAVNTLNANYGQTFAAMQRFVDNGGVLVFAAGNDGKADPGYWASLPYFKPTLQPGFLAAVAVDNTGVIASWSDRCGISAAYCLAAPGVNVMSTGTTGGYKTGSGTSFAAPIISGAVAVVMDMWPYLAPGDITSILLTTANKTGIYANTAIYGQGLLDLNKATQPVGTITIAGTNSITSLGQTELSSTFGKNGKAANVVVLDAFKRDFTVASNDLVVRNSDTFSPSAALGRFGTGLLSVDRVDVAGGWLDITSFTGANDSMGQRDQRHVTSIVGTGGWTANFATQSDGATATALTPLGPQWLRLAIADRSLSEGHGALIQNATGGSMALPFGDLSLSLGFASGQPGRDGVQNLPLQSAGPGTDKPTQSLWTAGLGYQVWSGVKLTGTAGYLIERDSILGSQQGGSMGFGTAARTRFVSIGADVALGGGLSLFGGYDMGWTNSSGATGALVSDVSTVRSNAWRAGLRGESVFDSGDTLLLAVSQPLAATKGRLTTMTPTSYDGFTGTVGYTSGSASLAAGHRETDLQAAYAMRLDFDLGLSFGGLLRLNPANDNAAPQAIGFTRLNYRF
jgi:subtilisin family serine protease